MLSTMADKIPTKILAKAAGFTNDVEIMRGFHLNLLKKNVRAFFNEFQTLDFESLSETKTQGFLDTHSLTVTNLLEQYSDLPRSY